MRAGSGVWSQLGLWCWPGVVAVRRFVKSSIGATVGGGAAGITRHLNRWKARYFGGVAGKRINGAGTADIRELQGIEIQGNSKRGERAQYPLEKFQTGNPEKTDSKSKLG